MIFTSSIENNAVTPVNSRGQEMKFIKENELINAYRYGLGANIELEGTDYDYIKILEAQRRFDKLSYVLTENETAYNFEFSIEDVSFDDYHRNCEIKVTPRDKYTEIQENEDIVVNLIDNKKEVIIQRYSRWHFFLTVTNGAPGQPNEVNKVVTSVGVSLFGKYVNLMVTELLDLDKDATAPNGWTQFVDLGDIITYQRFPVNFTPHYAADWVSPPDLSDYKWSAIAFYHNPWDESLYTLTKFGFGLKGSPIDFTSLWIKKSFYNGRANYVLDQAYSARELKDSLNRIISFAIPLFTGTVKSSFLFGDDTEPGRSLPDSYTDFPRYGKHLIEMSDFRKPNSQNPSAKLEITWKQISEYLCKKHQIFWYIDRNGDIRFEHESFFRANEIGVTVEDNLVYSYLQNSKPNREYMSESQWWNEDFAQIEVLYGSVPALNGVKENTKSTPLSNFYTDVDGLNEHLSELSDNGFVYVETYQESTPGGSGHDIGEIVKAPGFKSGETVQNANLSNANCLNLYYRHNAYQQSFKIGGKDVEAITLKRMKKQDIEFESTPDLTKLIQTGIMAGEIASLSYFTVEENKYKAEIHGN
jgi:hypothetical protein